MADRAPLPAAADACPSWRCSGDGAFGACHSHLLLDLQRPSHLGASPLSHGSYEHYSDAAADVDDVDNRSCHCVGIPDAAKNESPVGESVEGSPRHPWGSPLQGILLGEAPLPVGTEARPLVRSPEGDSDREEV